MLFEVKAKKQQYTFAKYKCCIVAFLLHTNKAVSFPSIFYYLICEFYATLYKKLIGAFDDIFLGLDLSGRTGVKYLAIKASISSGGIRLRKNSRHICAATEKLIIYAYFLFCF